jgi:hypothetical protein
MGNRKVLAALVGVVVVALVGLAVVKVLASPTAPSGVTDPIAPHFVEQAAAAGVTHAYDGDFEFYVGGGVAVFDCDGDHMPDMYLAGGTSPAGLYRNASQPGGTLQFQAIPSPSTDLGEVTGAYPIDIDSDGVVDLAVLRYGEDVLLRGLGGCRFERANEAWSFDGGVAWSTAFTARWDEGKQFPTMAIGHYLTSTDPNEFSCADNELIQPAADRPAFAAPQALLPGWCTLSMLFSDWDRSGRRDLRISNDRHYYGDVSGGQEQLWRIPVLGEPSEYNADEGWQPLKIWGMGIASYDVTGDGYPDYYLTSQGDNKLQALATDASRPDFKDIALGREATAHRPYEGDTTMPSTAWHDEFEDVNNDGAIDLFVSKGNVEAMPDFAGRDPSNLLLGDSSGMFHESAPEAGLVDFARARGAAVTDLNADGLLDMVVVTRRENVRLWRNIGAGTSEAPAPLGHWLSLQLSQDGSNRDAIGSWIEVQSGGRTQTREITIGGGHVSGQLGPTHFGLGPETSAQVRVTWPDGEVGPWLTAMADAPYLVTREPAEITTIQ